MPAPIQTDAPLAQLNNAQQSKAMAAVTVCALLVFTFPGALIGAGIAFVLWRVTRSDVITRWLIAGLSAASAVAFQPTVFHPWSWTWLATAFTPIGPDVSTDAVLSSLPAEALLGPLILLVFQLGLAYRRRTIHGQEWGRYRGVVRRKKALELGWPGPRGAAATADAQAHPPGMIRLGVSADDELPFDLHADEVATHVFVPGASGTGKTTTLVRLADGALANGYGVVIIDCKGVGLGDEARVLASRRGIPFTVVDPHDESSVGYDPCSGDAPTIANKLIGAFTFGGNAEIYKQIAMEVIPVICRAMADTGQRITLDAIHDALGRGGLARLGRTRGAEAYRDKLEEMEASGGIGAAGYVGLQKRLGALMEGTFGELFRKHPADRKSVV